MAWASIVAKLVLSNGNERTQNRKYEESRERASLSETREKQYSKLTKGRYLNCHSYYSNLMIQI